jgi:hypothetical protein
MIKELSADKHLLVLTGLACMLGAYLWYLQIRLSVNSFSFSNGTVVELKNTTLNMTDIRSTVIRFYSTTGEWIELVLANRGPDSSLNDGEPVNLIYPANKPLSAVVYNKFDLWGGPVLVVSIGICLLLSGLMFIVSSAVKARHLQEINGKTTTLQTLFVNVEKNRSAEVDGHLPYCIYSQWRNPKTSEVYFFQSKNLWTDPSKYIKGKKITVYVEHDNLKEYSVDLSFLPRRITNSRSGLSG